MLVKEVFLPITLRINMNNVYYGHKHACVRTCYSSPVIGRDYYYSPSKCPVIYNHQLLGSVTLPPSALSGKCIIALINSRVPPLTCPSLHHLLSLPAICHVSHRYYQSLKHRDPVVDVTTHCSCPPCTITTQHSTCSRI